MCKQSPSELEDKRDLAQTHIYIEIVSSIVIVVFTLYAKSWVKDMTKNYDEKTVTPSDYTLFFRIDPEQNKIFNKYFYNPNSDVSRGEQMRNWIWDQLAVFSKDERIKIARIDLSFDNRRMINLLRQRGDAIKNSDHGSVFQTEHLINLEKLRQYNTNVCGFFITFENDSDVKLAKKICDQTKLQIFGKAVSISRAKEPSNYIWENMGYTDQHQNLMFYVVIAFLALVLFLAYNLQFDMQQSISYFDNFEKFDCDLFHNSIPDIDSEVKAFDDPDSDQDEGSETTLRIQNYTRVKYQKEAYTTWKNFYQPSTEDEQLTNYINGTLSCFCGDEFNKRGFWTAFKEYRADGIDQLPESVRDDIEEKEEESQALVETNQICKKYVLYEKFSESYYIITSIVIIIYNALFYMLVEPIVRYIGYHIRTNEIRVISFTIFLCLVSDMFLLPLFLGMNWIDHSDNRFSNQIFRGKYTDFSHGWYTDVGF